MSGQSKTPHSSRIGENQVEKKRRKKIIILDPESEHRPTTVEPGCKLSSIRTELYTLGLVILKGLDA